MIKTINNIFKNFGIIINRYPTRDLDRRIKILKKLGTTLVLDVGASRGEYGEIMRRIGYKNKIISFEPIKVSFDALKKLTDKDIKWQSCNYALGNFDGETEINISKNLVSSSILKMNDLHTLTNINTKQATKEVISVKRLDSIFSTFTSKEEIVFLKLDTQGYEKHILEGAVNSLSNIAGIQIELSIEPLYDGSDNYLTMIELLDKSNFALWSVEPGFQDHKSGRLLQFDGIFLSQKYQHI